MIPPPSTPSPSKATAGKGGAMGPRFTPGPWVAIGSSVFSGEADEIRFRIAMVLVNNDDAKDAAPLADARLIAAAPDLYAALIGVLTPGHSADCGPGGGCPLCTAARAAIAKAGAR